MFATEDWFNEFGLVIMIVMVLPSLFFYWKRAEDFQNKFKCGRLEVLEQIGRYGSFAFMVFQMPHLCVGLWFEHAAAVYLIVNGSLIFSYCAAWIFFWRYGGLAGTLILSILPSAIFLFSGFVLLNIPLLCAAALFSVSHIAISYQNAALSRPGRGD